MYYQIYDTQHNQVIITCPTLEDAQAFLRLYEAGERLHLKINCIFKDEHPLRRQGSFRRY
jgi:ribosomal protein L21E